MIRNEILLLLVKMSAGNEEVAKILAFEGGYVVVCNLFEIMMFLFRSIRPAI